MLAPDATDEAADEAPEAAATGSKRRVALAALGRNTSVVAPLARQLNGRLRGVSFIAATQDRISGAWDRVVEAFCQAAEPLLKRAFPDLRLIAVVDGDGSLVLHRVGRDRAATLGSLDALAPTALAELAATRWSAVELRLPAAQIFERKLSLPAASREFLAPIIEHRLDRLTPWRPDRVLYGFRVDGGDASDGAVSVTLTATSRDLVAAPLQRIGAVGLVPTAVGAEAEEPQRSLAVNLLGGGAAMPPRAKSHQFVSRTALVVGGLSLVAFIATAVLAAGAAGGRDAAAQNLAKARRLLRASSIHNLGSREQLMLAAKQPARSTLLLIDALSTAIPADTYLNELVIQPDKVRLVGSSGNAPALIGEIEAAGLRNVRFTSAIARNREGRDDFELGAERPQGETGQVP